MYLQYEFSISIIYLNIITYLILNFAFFSLIFIFDTNFLISLNDLKKFGNLKFFSLTFILLFLSFAGVPPTLGFLSKSLIFVFIFFKKFFFFFLSVNLLNFFLIYFYIKNIRFLISKSEKVPFLFNNNYSSINVNFINFLNLINFFNIMSLFYFEDLIIFLDNINFIVNFF
jgi:NADH:ubiquinone oxidoreductase subunit 2 (subunit N)